MLNADVALFKELTTSIAMIPMTSDLFLRLIRLAAEVLLCWKDFTPDSKRGLFGPAGVRLCLNLSNVFHLISRERIIRRVRLSDAMIADILETQDLEAYRPQQPPPSLRVIPLLRALVNVYWGLRWFAAGYHGAAFPTQDLRRSLPDGSRAIRAGACRATGFRATHRRIPALLLR
jgi:hypothetical protein